MSTDTLHALMTLLIITNLGVLITNVILWVGRR